MGKIVRIFNKFTLVSLVLLLMLGTILVACSNKESGGSGNQEFRFTLASEPPSLDPALMTDAQSSIVASGLYDGLMRLNSAGEPEPSIAKDYKVSDDGKTYTFDLRKDAKWSNGDPVTAHDFVYSWQRALAPETASDYAYLLYYLENGQQYNAGEITDPNQVGVKALDDYTLEAKLYTPAPYFISLVAHYTYFPVHKATVEGKPDWAAEADTMVTNGPFLLSEWAHEDKLILKKNPDYFNKDKVSFNKVTITLVNDANTVYNLFETNEIDWIGAQAGSVVTDLTPKLVSEGKAEIKAIASVYYYLFNTQKAPFNNVKIRKAFAMAVNRQDLIDNVTKANQTPAFGLVPPSIAGMDGKSYRELYPDNFFKEDVEEAKKLLAEGLKDSGLSELPETTLLYNTDEGHKKIAEAIADMWRKNLGVEVKLANQEWGTFLESRDAGQFDVARSGWGADFNHAINFTYDLIHPTSGNNDGKYNNSKVGELLEASMVATDEKKRLDMIAEAEKIAFKDDMGALPLYYYTTVVMQKDGFKDVVSDYSGNLDWAFGSKK
jgi:oligopeptide transport system substrate-binding protein